METVQVKDKQFRKFLSQQQLQERITALATQLNRDYTGKRPLLLPILNGAFLFAADLIRQLRVEPELQFIRVASYHDQMESSGEVELLLGLDIDLKDRHILLLDDIVDTGRTYDFLYKYLIQKNPASVDMACLLFKPEKFAGKRRPGYIGFSIPPAFVVGFGLDYAQGGRELPAIYQLDE